MNKKDILIRAQFIQPGSSKHEFYSSNTSESYIGYIKNRETGDEITKTYIGYIENRHGADTFKTSNIDNTLSKVPKKALVHDIVISYSDDYKYANNVLTYKQTIPAMEKTINDFLRMNNMDPVNYQWAVAHHTSNGHPHIHIRLNEIKATLINRSTGELEFRKKGKLSKTSIEEWKKNLDAYFTRAQFFIKEVSKQKLATRELIEKSIAKNSKFNMEVYTKVSEELNKTTKSRISVNSLTKTQHSNINKIFRKWVERNEEVDLGIKTLYTSLNSSGFSKSEISRRKKEVDDALMNKFIKGMVGLAKVTIVKKDFEQLNHPGYRTAKRFRKNNYAKHKPSMDRLLREMENATIREANALERAIQESQRGIGHAR